MTLDELTWWKNNIIESTNAIVIPEIDKIIYTDASNAGWGFFLRNISNGGDGVAVSRTCILTRLSC